MDVIIVIASVASALAALGALWFARDTVRESRALRHEDRLARREDRLARLPELVADLGETGLRIRADRNQQPVFSINARRLGATLAATPEVLRACHELASFPTPEIMSPIEPLLDAVDAALIELAERLGEASDVEGALK